MTEKEAVNVVLKNFAAGTEKRKRLEADICDALVHSDASWSNWELASRLATRFLKDIGE